MEINSRKPDKNKQGKQMIAATLHQDDVRQVRFLMRTIGGDGRVNDFIYRVFKVMTALFPHEGDPKKQWTERRLKAWWNNETDVVRHWQMMELFAASEAVKSEREMLNAARKEHAEFIQKTARLRQMAKSVSTHPAGGLAER